MRSIRASPHRRQTAPQTACADSCCRRSCAAASGPHLRAGFLTTSQSPPSVLVLVAFTAHQLRRARKFRRPTGADRAPTAAGVTEADDQQPETPEPHSSDASRAAPAFDLAARSRRDHHAGRARPASLAVVEYLPSGRNDRSPPTSSTSTTATSSGSCPLRLREGRHRQGAVPPTRANASPADMPARMESCVSSATRWCADSG